jgi:membrane-associated phospholipid phosphatase
VPRRLRIAAAVAGVAFVCAVGCSVLVLQWHYPSDVLGGVLVALGWACAAVAVLRMTERPPAFGARQPGSRAAISVK